MTRLNGALLLVVLVEVVVGGVVLARRTAPHEVPQADWDLLDPVTADELRTAVAGCRTAAEWRDLGERYLAAGCFSEAERCHRVACELDPKNATYARQWGFALERLALLDQANDQYRRALKLRSTESDACRYFIARNLLRAEAVAAARTLFDEGKQLPANRHELARLHLRAGRLDEADAQFRSLTLERPRAIQMHLLGYRLALERGDAQGAARHADGARYSLEKLQNPFDEEAARVLAVTATLGPGGQWKEARDLIEAQRVAEAAALLRAAAQQRDNAGIQELLAELALRTGQPTEAVRLYEDHQAQRGPAARVFAKLGDAYQALGDAAQARANWERAARLEAGADLKDVHHKLATSYRDAGDQVAATRHLARGHYYVGRELLKFGYADKAVGYFEGAVREDTALVAGWYYLGEAQRLAGQADEATRAYRKCLDLNPHHGRALAALGVDVVK